MRIRISWKSKKVVAVLNDTPTSKKLVQVLPCKSTAHTWGDEVYFDIPVESELEPNARQVVDAGTICFWVEGQSLAIPFGPTPMSQGNECRLVTKVNVLGKVEGDCKVLESVKSGEPIQVELVS